MPVTTAIASSCLVSRDTLADIDPYFRKRHQYRPDTSKAVGVSNCEKVIERDVEAYREKSQSFCVHLGARSADVVSYNAQFAAMVAEQHALDGMFDHRQSIRTLPRWLWYLRNDVMQADDIALQLSQKSGTRFKVKRPILYKMICKRRRAFTIASASRRA